MIGKTDEQEIHGTSSPIANNSRVSKQC